MTAGTNAEKPSAVFGVVIPAGGRGERIGGDVPKQFRSVGGVPMLLRSIRPFAQNPRVREIVIPLPANLANAPPDWLSELAGDRVSIICGGATRAESVHRGVSALSPACASVLIHDAARPFVSRDIIDAVIDVVETGDAAIAAVPVSDTLKRSDDSGRWIDQTVDRSKLWRAQTPQGFPREMLERAYRTRADWTAEAHTDEAALVEASGFRVALVLDSTRNYKITTPDDFTVAESLLRA